MMACFGAEIAADRIERNHRFIEEALELVQTNGCTRDEAHQLVDYVYGRDQGDISQEVGGVMVTLAALCLANGLDMHAAGETELARISEPETMEKVRAKQAAKPKHSPLPVQQDGLSVEVREEAVALRRQSENIRISRGSQAQLIAIATLLERLSTPPAQIPAAEVAECSYKCDIPDCPYIHEDAPAIPAVRMSAVEDEAMRDALADSVKVKKTLDRPIPAANVEERIAISRVRELIQNAEHPRRKWINRDKLLATLNPDQPS
jgi:hypothetical protein